MKNQVQYILNGKLNTLRPVDLENSRIDWMSHEMPEHVFIAEHTIRINFFDDLHKIIEARIQLAEDIRPQVMRFSPMRAPLMLAENLLESLKQPSIRDVETIRFVLDDPDPACPLAVARAKPDVIRCRKPDFHGKMIFQAVGVQTFLIKPGAQLLKA